MKRFLRPARLAFYAAALSLPALVLAGVSPVHAQTAATGALTGTVLDPRGVPLPGASISARSVDSSSAAVTTTSDGRGRYSFPNLSAGKYTIQVQGSGFASTRRDGVQIAAGKATDVAVTLELGNVSQEITVEASVANSVAATLAPMDALLDATSARTEVSSALDRKSTRLNSS